MWMGLKVKVLTGVLGLLVILSLGQRMQAQTENWQSFSYPNEGFSVSFPSTPTNKTQNVPTEKGSFELRAYLTEVGNTALFVGVCDYGSAINDRTPNQVLQGAKQGAAENVNAHITTEQNITLGIYPGVAFEADNDTMHFSARVYLVGTTLYQALTASPIKEPYAGTQRFLNSFQLIPRTAK
jgi:hypothetical protein